MKWVIKVLLFFVDKTAAQCMIHINKRAPLCLKTSCSKLNSMKFVDRLTFSGRGVKRQPGFDDLKRNVRVAPEGSTSPRLFSSFVAENRPIIL